MTLNYDHGISILKLKLNRATKPVTFFESASPLILDINLLGYKACGKLISDLSKVISGEYENEYEWEVRRSAFETNKEFTIIKDEVFDEPDLKIETKSILQLLKDRYAFFKTLEEDALYKKIRDAFEQIVESPEEYRKSDFLFESIIDSVKFSIILLKTDLEMDSDSFMKTIIVNKDFLPIQEELDTPN